MVAWVGLRGAAPIILATFPLSEGAAAAEVIFDAVFFIVITSVLIQGTSIPFVARRLRVAATLEVSPAWPLEPTGITTADAGLHEFAVPDDSPAAGTPLVELGLPPGTIVLLIRRAGSFLVPQGAARIEAGDEMLVLGPDDTPDVLRRRLMAAEH